MLVNVAGLATGQYFNTFIGKDIKRVTWNGGSSSSPPAHDELFAGSFDEYGLDDANYSRGDYNVYNSTVSVINKAGPLDNYASYIVEFDRAPTASEPINFFINFQGMASFDQIGPYLANDYTLNNTTYSDASTYTDTTSEGYAEPPLNVSTFTPTATEGVTIVTQDSFVRHQGGVAEYVYTPAITRLSKSLYSESLPAGDYILTVCLPVEGNDVSLIFNTSWNSAVVTKQVTQGSGYKNENTVAETALVYQVYTFTLSTAITEYTRIVTFNLTSPTAGSAPRFTETGGFTLVSAPSA